MNNFLIYLGCESVWRKGSGSKLRGDDGPILGPVPEDSSAEKELLPGAPRHHHLRSHSHTRVGSRLKQIPLVFLSS